MNGREASSERATLAEAVVGHEIMAGFEAGMGVSVDLSLFFPSDSKIFALPGWRRPRLYLPDGNARQRWLQSSFYPASRLRARGFRAVVRSAASFRVSSSKRVEGGRWILGEFLGDLLPGFRSAVLLVGTPGPGQKVTAQLWDGSGRVIGYLKYAESEHALLKLKNESDITSILPKGVGPEPLKYGAMGSGMALLKRPLPGEIVRAEDLPDKGVTELLRLFPSSEERFPVWEHPCLAMLGGSEDFRPEWLSPLSDRSWPVVVQHGDFAPWNLLRAGTGEVTALDWEFGSAEGFPLFDQTYYVLQTAALIKRRPPLEAAKLATDFILGNEPTGLSREAASAIVRLTAFDAYRKSYQTGKNPQTPLQRWRRTVWDSPPDTF